MRGIDTAQAFHGFISNAYTAALVSPEGSIDWWPLPRFDGESVFSALLDARHGGACSLRPVGPATARQSYLEGTNALVTGWQAAEGRASVTDFLAVGRAEIRRAIVSEVPMTLICEPRFQTGRTMAAIQPTAHGAIFANPVATDALELRGLGRAEPRGAGVWTLPPGRSEVVLRYMRQYEAEQRAIASGDDDPRPGVAARRVARFWRGISGPAYAGPYAAAVNRSLLVLRGLTFRTTGAPVAAATTSLPEVPGDGRQWDYRFVWIRDGSYAAEAMLLAGDFVAARRFVEFLMNSVDMVGKPFPCPFLRVDGTLDLGERECLWLAGHRDSRPVRIGNSATWQSQLDIEGDFLWLLWRYVEETGDLTVVREFWWAVRAICSWVAGNYRRPDASLWEFRDRPARYTHSAVMCWVALRCGARLAGSLGHAAEAGRWRAAAATLREEILPAARGRFRQRLDGGGPDAALLCLPLYGFVDAGDPRFRRTLGEIEARLCEDNLIFRYRADAMGPARHPFLLASFWLARAYIRAGALERAQAVLDRAVASATDLGLWGEHYDPATGEQRGNFPQLFVHAGMVTAAYELRAVQAGKALPGADLAVD